MNKLENFSFDLDDEPNLPVQDDIEQQETQVEDQDNLEDDDDFQEDVQEEIIPEEVDSKDPLAQATYEKYVELGILESVETFDGTFDSLEEMMEDVPSRLLNQAVLEIPESGRAVLQFIVASGSNVTKEEIINFVDTWKEENRTSFELEDEARNYLIEKYKKEGRKAIEAQVNELEDDGELINEANKYLAEENSKTQKLISTKKEQTEQQKQSEKQYYSAINEELKALNYSKKKVDDIQRTMNNANKVLNSIYAKPKAVVQLMDLLTKFNGETFDLSDFEKQGTTKAVSTIQAALSKSAQNSAGTKTASTQVSKVLSNPNRFEFTVD